MALPTLVLFALLAIFVGIFVVIWAKSLTSRRQWQMPKVYEIVVGAVTNFFDSLGIGSFATTTTLFRLRGTVSDEKIPGTLNIGHCLPICAQAVLFADSITVEPTTLILLVGASVIGAWLASGVVARMSKRTIQIWMGSALLVAAALLLMKLWHLFPAGGDEVGLSGWKLVVGTGFTFVFGALMTIGIGAYAPVMILVALLGMNPTTAWPIMTGVCAFLMPVCGVRFVREQAYSPRAALGLTLGGIPGVLVAVYIFNQLPMDVVRWLVLAVVLYTAVTLLRSARK